MTPLITIVIPTYRRPKMLAKAIKSALCQTVQEIQVFVCDNASEDETASVVEDLRQLDKRLHYFSQEKNKGMIANYEFGMSLVNTQYFSFLSDDDILFPSFCETALNDFAKYPDIAFAALSTLIISPQYHLVYDPLAQWKKEGYFAPSEGSLELVGKYPVLNTTLLHTERARSIPIDYHNAVLWDYDFLLHIAIQHPIAINKHHAGLFFQHANSLTTNLAFTQWITGFEKIILKIKESKSTPELLKTKITSLVISQETIHNALRKIFHSHINKDEESTKIYEKFLRSQSGNFTFKMEIYWAVFRCRKIFPGLARFLNTTWQKKAEQHQKAAVPITISSEYSDWDAYFERDYEEISRQPVSPLP